MKKQTPYIFKNIIAVAFLMTGCIVNMLFPAKAQPFSPSFADQLPEPLYAHFDKPFYAVGETMWFSVFFLNPETAESKVIYIDMVDKGGKVVMQQKLKADSVGAFSEFTIPFSWQEGYFQFRAYTLWNLNFDKPLVFTKNIPIYSEWKQSLIRPEYEENITKDISLPANDGALKMVLKTDKTTYQKREKVNLNIKVTDANGKPVQAFLSLSVTDLDLLPVPDGEHIVSYQEKEQSFYHSSLSAQPGLLPEKSLTLNGNVFNPKDSSPVSTRFLSVYLAESHKFLNTEISGGKLSLQLPDFYGSQTIQVHDHNPYQPTSPKVEVFDLTSRLPVAPLAKVNPARTPAIERYLYLSSMRRQLNEVFGAKQENMVPVKQDTVAFVPDKVYQMNDYQLLKTMEDFIREVIFKARIREENGHKTVRLYNPETQKYFEDAPWYMVNGYLTGEAEALNIPANAVKTVHFFYNKNTLVLQFPPMMVRTGVLSIETRDDEISHTLMNAPNSFLYDGFYLPKSFEDFSNSPKQTPDFRPLVHWKPQIATDSNGEATLTFNTTDAISLFLIHVEGISRQGETGVAEVTYEVTFK